MQRLTVNLGSRSYSIYVGERILDQAGDLLLQSDLRGKVAVVTNPVVAQLYLDPVHEALGQSGFEVTPILVPDGESQKNLRSLERIYEGLIRARLERGSCVLALGGGVVGDLAGFAAATYLRGIPYVQVPTTLLAQVDSSVGGKTGVNHEAGKNLIGAFHQPKFVLIDVDVLRTLPAREFVAGLAEVIKYAIIEDAALFQLLEDKLEKLLGSDRALLIQIVATCCAIKARVVEQDERENDYRAVLNFGHTVGHALEAATGYRQFLHGEAVAVGMAKAAALSQQQGYCDQRTVSRIVQLINRSGLPHEIPSNVSIASVLEGMGVDKKKSADMIKFVMCQGIGKTRFHWISQAEIARVLGGYS